MKKILILLLLNTATFLLAQEKKENYLMTNSHQEIKVDYFQFLEGKTIKVNRQNIEFKGYCTFDEKFKGYDKPRHIGIEDTKGLQKKLGKAIYNTLKNKLKAGYIINQNENQFIIRSICFLKIKSNTPVIFKAMLFTIYTEKDKMELVIINDVKRE